jgi:2-pyrone-4,6-dicarboxylate lactonase
LKRYPYAGDLRYRPPHAPLDEYLKIAVGLGIERYVFVQPSAYGRDNACMVDAMREMGPHRCRGIVDIDENASDGALERLHAAGVRGVRVNVNPIKPAQPGWMLDFLTPGWLTRELLPTFKKLKSAFSIAHMGMFLAKDNAAGVCRFFQEPADMLGKAHRRLPHLDRAALRRRRAARAGADRRGT